MSPNHQASRGDVENPAFALRDVADMQLKPSSTNSFLHHDSEGIAFS
jgi:hypothetical protein